MLSSKISSSPVDLVELARERAAVEELAQTLVSRLITNWLVQEG